MIAVQPLIEMFCPVVDEDVVRMVVDSARGESREGKVASWTQVKVFHLTTITQCSLLLFRFSSRRHYSARAIRSCSAGTQRRSRRPVSWPTEATRREGRDDESRQWSGASCSAGCGKLPASRSPSFFPKLAKWNSDEQERLSLGCWSVSSQAERG